MPEDNQIQPGFQPENQVNPQIQQNNFIQEQQVQGTTQQVIQQNNSTQNQQQIQGITQQIIQQDNVAGTQQNISQSIQQYAEKQVQTIYYHPSWLTKILSGIYRFIGIALVWAGLWNFSLIGTDGLSFLKILYVGGIITLCGILFIILGGLLYSTKNKFHLGFSLLGALIVNIMFSRILRAFTDNSYGINSDIFESLGVIIVTFTLIYFSILTIRWIIKYRKFKKKGIINPKYLDSTPSKKKVGIITTIILLSIVIVDLIYGKIQWSKTPEIDESIFNRTEHQTKLPDEEDALIQLKLFQKNNYELNNDEIMTNLEKMSLLLNSYDENEKIEWKYHPEECIKVYSGGNEYCGTWAWNDNTLNRWLNHHLVIFQKEDYETNEKINEYLTVDGKAVTILEYMDKYEPEIRKKFQELDHILSMDYYLPDDEVLDLLPSFLQGWTRSSISAIRYYIYKEDWDMVMFIIQINYKSANILNNIGSVVGQLISLVIQGITDYSINSHIQLFPKDFRKNLSKQYSTQIDDKNEIIDKTVKGEYVIWNWAKNGNIMGEVGKDTPGLFQFLFNFPFFSSKEINNLMNYSYYLFWDSLDDTKIDIDSTRIDIDDIIYSRSLYNWYGKYPFNALMPRMSSINDRINKNIYHKENLIKNLESGKYDIWFSRLDWEYDPYEYERNRIPTDEELFENKIKSYSDITNPCFGRDVLDPEYNPYYYTNFLDTCTQTLSELKEQDDDDFGLKEILIEISQLRIDYYEIEKEIDDCFSKEGNICKNIISKHYENLEKIKKAYVKFLDILETIKNKSPEINIYEYFYIPEMIHNKRDKLDDLELNDTKLNDLEFEDIELPESMNIIKEYSNIIQPCFGKDIIDPIPDIGVYHDDFEEICSKTLKELRKQENDDFGLKEILIEITKSLINHSKFETKVDACWLKEGILPKACEEIFNKGDELVNKVKENYIKLSEVLESIENENPEINIDKYFYIPYNKVHDKSNGIIVGFFIDQEKAEQILKDIESEETN